MQMYLFSYKIHPLLYLYSQHVYLLSIVYLCFILLPSMFNSLFSMSPCFLSCFTALMMLAQPSWAMICLNIMFVLRSLCRGAFCHVYAQIYMFMCSLPCLCLDLHVGVLLAMFMCLNLHVGCHVLLQPFLSLVISLSCVLAL